MTKDSMAEVGPRIAFLDFEASSLGKHGFPVEVGWVFSTGEAESFLIKPAPGWEEWDAEAEAIHGISQARLQEEGTAHDVVAGRMMEVFAGVPLYASAPSWDGKWLSLLLRSAGFQRHALRLQDTEVARREIALAVFASAGLPTEVQERALPKLLEDAKRHHEAATPGHRALADARHEMALLRLVADEASAFVAAWSAAT
jgi:hypothetical protein